MELRELITKLPPRSEVVILTRDDGSIPTTPAHFEDDIEDGSILLKYKHAEVKAIEYNFRCCAYQVVVEPVTLNIDKLKEMFPFASLTDVTNNLKNFDIDDGTCFSKKWLYAPYNKEEGKEEE